jgi:hypothetical protein
MILAAINSLVAVGALVVAIVGLNTWRAQLRGTAEYELARRVLRAVLNVRDKISEVRNPLVSASETESDQEGPPIGTLDETLRAGQRRAYERRWNNLVKARSALRLELLEAEVLWGAAIRTPERQLNECIGELFAAMHLLVNPRPTGLPDRYFAVVYEGTTTDGHDEFGDKVMSAVESFERILRPHIGRSLVRRRAA